MRNKITIPGSGKRIIHLSGNSGSDVFLYRDKNGHSLVRKQSNNVAQSNRLLQQYEKSMFLSKLQNNLFKIPYIIRTGYENSLFFYEYEYIEGENFITYIQKESIEEAKWVIDKLFLIIENFSKNDTYFESEFKNKDLKEAIRSKIVANSDAAKLNLKLKEKMLSLLEKIPSTTKKTLHHGDLAFDNIIIDRDKNVWLIDCLGSFYPHYWMDVVRLFMDTEGEWYKIKYNMSIEKKKIVVLNDYIKGKVRQFDKEYMKYHNLFMALTLLRILPYMQRDLDKKKILLKIKAFVNRS